MASRFALLATALVLALATGCGDPEDGYVIIGDWKGELTQKDLAPFEVTAKINDLEDPAANTVHYTGIDCGGNWTFLGRQDGGFRFREVIDRGAGGNCKGVGVVTLTPRTENTVGYVFKGGGIESRGVLSRVE
jgi:hypothetical protein